MQYCVEKAELIVNYFVKRHHPLLPPMSSQCKSYKNSIPPNPKGKKEEFGGRGTGEDGGSRTQRVINELNPTRTNHLQGQMQSRITDVHM